jgi:MFS family permease
MTEAIAEQTAAAMRRPWTRELQHYPGSRVRYTSLAVAVLATIVLYYQLYLAGGVATHILADYNISFRWYVNLQVIGTGAAALFAYFAGLADRYGRGNIITAGLLAVGLLSLIGIPLAHGKWPFALVFGALSAVEGLILVTTPAVVRDFSPQLGRASAMGFWTMGPVLGSLVITVVVGHSSNTSAWQDQYMIAGAVGLVVAIGSIFFLKELAPALRDQVMVDARDRALIEARMKGIDVEASLKHPTRQMLKPDIVLSSIAISLFLMIYIVLVAFMATYFQVVFKFSQSEANSVLSWDWAFNAIGLVGFGWVSDKVGVRKPFMLAGAVVAVIFQIVFLTRATHPDTSYAAFAAILSIYALFAGMAYVAWMASFTETVERRNPALVASGLGIWGLIIRIIVALTIFFVPFVISTVTTIIQQGPVVQQIAAGRDPHLSATENAAVAAIAANPAIVPKVQSLAATYGPELATGAAIDPAAQQALAANPADKAAQVKAVGEIAAGLHVSPAAAAARRVALAKVPAADLAFLTKYGPPLQDPKVTANLKYLSVNAPKVLKAEKDGPGQWQDYFWACVAGSVIFIPLIWVMAGYWDPRRAKRAIREHDALAEAELAKAGGLE